MIARRVQVAVRFLVFSAAAIESAYIWAAGGLHEHGAATLLLSAEAQNIQVEVTLPAESVVGFETEYATAEQREAVEQARAALLVPSHLFVLHGNTCELTDATVDVGSILGPSQTPSEEYHQKDHEHEDLESARGDHKHPIHDEDAESASNSHSDISASYSFECESDEAITRVAFGTDQLPFGLERIDVLWVADWGQGAAQALPETPQVTLQN
jgi:hypothetical protein